MYSLVVKRRYVMRRFSVRPLFGFIAIIGLSLTPISALAQHGGGGGQSGGGGGGSHGGGGGGGFHCGSGGGSHGGAPHTSGAPHGSVGAPRSGASEGGRSLGTGEAGRGNGPSRSMSSQARSNGPSNIHPAINDGQWHSFGSAGNSTRAASARPANSLVARSTGFNGGWRSFGGEPRFGIGGGFRGGWGGGWRGGCCWGGGFGFGYGWGWPYWGPAWAFAWDPFWYPPYWYNPYLYGTGYGYYSDSSYNSDASYNTPPYRSEVLSEYEKNEDSPTVYLNRPSDDDNNDGAGDYRQDDNHQTSQPGATPSSQVPVADQTNPSLFEN